MPGLPEWFENYDQFNDIILYTKDGYYVTSKNQIDGGYRDGSPWLKRALAGEPGVAKPSVVESTAQRDIPDLENSIL